MKQLFRQLILKLPLILKKIIFFGKNHFCPVCERSISKFLSYGDPERSNAFCPMCGSLERHRFAWKFFKDKTNLFDPFPKKMLHFAPEKIFKFRLKGLQRLEYHTADLSQPGTTFSVDIENTPFPENTYDVVYCSHVLEHVSSDRQAMRELCRILKPGGWAVFQVPILSDKTIENSEITNLDEQKKLFGQRDHVRSYGIDFKDRLEEEGFKVTAILPSEVWGKNFDFSMGIPDEEKLFFCEKTNRKNQ